MFPIMDASIYPINKGISRDINYIKLVQRRKEQWISHYYDNYESHYENPSMEYLNIPSIPILWHMT